MSVIKAKKTSNLSAVSNETSNETVENLPEAKAETVNPKSLWDAVRKLEEESSELQAKLDAVNAKKSRSLGEIQKAQGTGPYQIAGLGMVTIRSRKPKTEGAETTYFFVGLGSKSVTVID